MVHLIHLDEIWAFLLMPWIYIFSKSDENLEAF